MIKRPLNAKFTPKVLSGIKITTIRETPWPIGKPIMLYNWSGKPYRSKQTDVAAVIATGFWPIQITHKADGSMEYVYGMETSQSLFVTEGFDSQHEMDDWFRLIVKRGHTMGRHLMRFRLVTAPALSREQFAILYHTEHRAAGGFYCGGGKDMDTLVAAGLMVSAGHKSFVPDEYFQITSKGRVALHDDTL